MQGSLCPLCFADLLLVLTGILAVPRLFMQRRPGSSKKFGSSEKFLLFAVSLVYALHVAISPVDCWFWFCSFVFLLGTFRYAVPDAWRLWAGPRLAYCCG